MTNKPGRTGERATEGSIEWSSEKTKKQRETMSAINQDRAITNHICKVKGVEDLHPVWQREDYAGPGFYVISDGTYEMTGPFAEYESAKVEAEDQIESGEINNEELV